MASAKRVEGWIWPLVFGGLLLLCVGIFVLRTSLGLGWTFVTLGALAALAGLALIVVRSRMQTPKE